MRAFKTVVLGLALAMSGNLAYSAEEVKPADTKADKAVEQAAKAEARAEAAAPQTETKNTEVDKETDVKKKKQTAAEILKTPVQQFSYCVGLDIANSLTGIPSEMDIDMVLRAIKDKYADKTSLLSDEEVNSIKMEFTTRMRREMQEKQEKAAVANREEGKKYLEENKAKKGVVVTASGLQYEVLTEGKGASPKATDTVKVHYRGTLIDGTEFDSSYKRGEPTSFPVNRVIKGWTEGLQLMKVGGKNRLVIPSELAYGSRGAGQDIGPDATLVFEVELLGIE